MNSRLSITEECVSDLENRIMEITPIRIAKTQKKFLKNENSLDLRDNTKHANI